MASSLAGKRSFKSVEFGCLGSFKLVAFVGGYRLVRCGKHSGKSSRIREIVFSKGKCTEVFLFGRVEPILVDEALSNSSSFGSYLELLIKALKF